MHRGNPPTAEGAAAGRARDYHGGCGSGSHPHRRYLKAVLSWAGVPPAGPNRLSALYRPGQTLPGAREVFSGAEIPFLALGKLPPGQRGLSQLAVSFPWGREDYPSPRKFPPGQGKLPGRAESFPSARMTISGRGMLVSGVGLRTPTLLRRQRLPRVHPGGAEREDGQERGGALGEIPLEDPDQPLGVREVDRTEEEEPRPKRGSARNRRCPR